MISNVNGAVDQIDATDAMTSLFDTAPLLRNLPRNAGYIACKMFWPNDVSARPDLG